MLFSMRSEVFTTTRCSVQTLSRTAAWLLGLSVCGYEPCTSSVWFTEPWNQNDSSCGRQSRNSKRYSMWFKEPWDQRTSIRLRKSRFFFTDFVLWLSHLTPIPHRLSPLQLNWTENLNYWRQYFWETVVLSPILRQYDNHLQCKPSVLILHPSPFPHAFPFFPHKWCRVSFCDVCHAV